MASHNFINPGINEPKVSCTMTHQDTILALILAAQIHGTQKAVKTTAKRCAKLLPKAQRTLMLTIASSPRPMTMVDILRDELGGKHKRTFEQINRNNITHIKIRALNAN